MIDIHTRRRVLVDLFPQFLMRRRRGWTGIQELLERAQLTRPALFLLRAIVEETAPGERLSRTELCARLFNPYNTVYPWLDLLPELVVRDLVVQAGEWYIVSAQGRTLIEELEHGAQAYLATLTPVPAADLERMADLLSTIAARAWAAPEPAAKPHQARAYRLPLSNTSAMVRLDRAVYALWTSRDDAHNAAWQRAGFDGPAFDLLTRLWCGEATTLAELAQHIGQGQRPEDIEQGVAALAAGGYVVSTGAALALTDHGRLVRDTVEEETDRVYFTPWPPLTLEEVSWLYETLQAVCERLAT
jgi:hypothetical protein